MPYPTRSNPAASPAPLAPTAPPGPSSDAPQDDGWGWRSEPVPEPETRRRRPGEEPQPLPVQDVRPFRAEIDMTELDDRGRPTTTWSARTRSISRSSLVIASRRMCYQNRLVAVLVHLIDDQPVPLLGRVVSCHYEGDGLCLVELELMPVPKEGPIRAWIARGGGSGGGGGGGSKR